MTNEDDHKFGLLDDINWDTVWQAFKIISTNFPGKTQKKGDSDAASKIEQLMQAKYHRWLNKNLDTIELEIAMRLLFAKQTAMTTLFTELSAKKELSFLVKAINSLKVSKQCQATKK